MSKLSSRSVKIRAIRSTAWTLFNYGSQQAIRLASNLILTRLLEPEMFGIMALAQVFIVAINMFSDLGINTSIIKNREVASKSFLNTAWTIQIIRGGLISLICVIIAYPISILYEQPILFPVISVIGLNALIQGFKSTGFATAEKNLTFGRKTSVELISQLVGIILIIGWSAIVPSIWALVCGGIFSSVISVVLGHIILNDQHSHAIRIDRAHLKDMIHFGKWIFLTSMIGFFVNHLDKLLLGKLLSMNELGIFTIALTLANLPGAIAQQIKNKVMLPVYSNFQNTEMTIIRSYAFKMRLRITALTLPPSLLLMLGGENLIKFLYDERYHDGGWMLETLALGVAIRVATDIGPFLLSRGDSKTFSLIVVIRTFFVFFFMIAGWKFYSLEGLIFSLAAANFATYLSEAIIYSRFKIWLWQFDFSLLMLIAIVFVISKTL